MQAEIKNLFCWRMQRYCEKCIWKTFQQINNKCLWLTMRFDKLVKSMLKSTPGVSFTVVQFEIMN